MKLSKKSQYACLALIDLGENHEKGYQRIFEIAERKEIPKRFLEQILLILKRGGYVISRKGAEGGYKLAKRPENSTLAEIIRLMDGALAPVDSVSTFFYDHTPVEKSEKLLALFKEIRDYVAVKMEATTIEHLLP